MFKGFVLSESLKNPTLLNEFKQIRVIIECHPESNDAPKIWHDFTLEVADKDIKGTCKKISMAIREGWYAHFWNEDILYVILLDKVFRLPREDGNWKSQEYLACKKYAMAHGVDERYMKSFLIVD